MTSARKLLAALASGALVISSTAAAAAAPVPYMGAQAAQVQPDPWLMLTAMGPTRAVALGGAAAAAQPVDEAPPGTGPGINGEVIPVFVMIALIALALLAISDEGDEVPVSPG
jgi:hypothetical protein